MDIPIEQKLSDAEKELQTMLTNQNVVRDAKELISKQVADIELQIMKLDTDKKQLKIQIIGLSAADKKADNNISAQRSKIKVLTQEFWADKNRA